MARQENTGVVIVSPSNEIVVDIVPTRTKKASVQWRDAVAGACAGGLAKTAVAPIERVKLLMQLQGSLDSSSSSSSSSVLHNGTTTNKYGNQKAWEVARMVYMEQGILAFWRGNLPNVLRQAGSAGLNFMLMDWYKTAAVSPLLMQTLTWPSERTTETRKRRRALWSSFLSGGLAGGTATTVLYPIEFLRTRLAMDVGGTKETRLYPRGMRDVFGSTFQSDGIKGMYQGYGIALLGVFVYRALHLGGYDALKAELIHRRLSNNNNNNNNNNNTKDVALTWTERFLAAQIVSLMAGTICYPIDSVRRRLMMQAGIPLEQRLYQNSFQCFRRVWALEGTRGFYLGLGPNLVRSLGGALLLVAYDVFKVML